MLIKSFHETSSLREDLKLTNDEEQKYEEYEKYDVSLFVKARKGKVSRRRGNIWSRAIDGPVGRRIIREIWRKRISNDTRWYESTKGCQAQSLFENDNEKEKKWRLTTNAQGSPSGLPLGALLAHFLGRP
uniref:Uncharacterized protein n=1 Tax=Vespula pensylvanica TaxID=30213 RepID=A0A834PA34_VESPE|nr:hypothetical protein H0235_002339 [Vespula pensylvanica]